MSVEETFGYFLPDFTEADLDIGLIFQMNGSSVNINQ